MQNLGVMHPGGPIAAGERLILLNATTVMLAIIVPIILATAAFAWWFRSGNERARRRPDWAFSGPLEVVVWAVPALVILFLGAIAWIGSHALDPRAPIESKVAPLDIQVVSLDWKWLFIYPDAGVASVNRMTVPEGTPLRLHLTSATVMNSFLVPELGSQIYTMPRMTTQLNLMADKAGTYPGLSAQFSGDGFSSMRFELVAVSHADYETWISQAKAGHEPLDAKGYADLAKPGTVIEPRVFSSIDPALFDKVSGSGRRPARDHADAGNFHESLRIRCWAN